MPEPTTAHIPRASVDAVPRASVDAVPRASRDAIPGASHDSVPWASVDASHFADPAHDLFASHLWFDLIARCAAPPGLHPACVTGSGFAIPVWTRAGRLHAGQSTPYALEYRPILGPDPIAAGRAFRRTAQGSGVIRLDGLDPAQPGLDAFLAAAGRIVRRFHHFNDWFAPVTTDDFSTWLATRPGALRSTVTRKLKRAAKTSTFSLITGEPGLDPAIAAFERVYAASWKQPEPHPGFNPACIRALASAGLLRLGILSDATGPIAAQYWAISGGRAMLLKLAHAETSTETSPGTVLTARMIEAILRHDRPAVIDFGRGDDPYKRLWVDQHRPRIGALLIDPRHPAGLAALARASVGTLRRRLTRTQA